MCFSDLFFPTISLFLSFPYPLFPSAYSSDTRYNIVRFFRFAKFTLVYILCIKGDRERTKKKKKNENNKTKKKNKRKIKMLNRHEFQVRFYKLYTALYKCEMRHVVYISIRRRSARLKIAISFHFFFKPFALIFFLFHILFMSTVFHNQMQISRGLLRK